MSKQTFWVKVIGGKFCGYVQAVDMRSAVLKAIGKRASTKGTMIIDRVSVVAE